MNNSQLVEYVFSFFNGDARGMAYKVAIRRPDGSWHIDQEIYENDAPQPGSMRAATDDRDAAQ